MHDQSDICSCIYLLSDQESVKALPLLPPPPPLSDRVPGVNTQEVYQCLSRSHQAVQAIPAVKAHLQLPEVREPPALEAGIIGLAGAGKTT